MSEHYYTETPTSGHDERQIALRALGRELTFTTDAGVFSRDGLDRGTEVLLDALPVFQRSRAGQIVGRACRSDRAGKGGRRAADRGGG